MHKFLKSKTCQERSQYKFIAERWAKFVDARNILVFDQENVKDNPSKTIKAIESLWEYVLILRILFLAKRQTKAKQWSPPESVVSRLNDYY